MSGLKEFGSEDKKLFYEVAMQETVVDAKTISKLEGMIKSLEYVTTRKNDCIRLSAEFVNEVYYDDPPLQDSSIIRTLIDDPLNFRIRSAYGSPLKRAEDFLRQISLFSNSLVFNYRVCLELIKYLKTVPLQPTHLLAEENKNLTEKYIEALKKVAELEIELKKQALSAPKQAPLPSEPIKETNDITPTPNPIEETNKLIEEIQKNEETIQAISANEQQYDEVEKVEPIDVEKTVQEIKKVENEPIKPEISETDFVPQPKPSILEQLFGGGKKRGRPKSIYKEGE